MDSMFTRVDRIRELMQIHDIHQSGGMPMHPCLIPPEHYKEFITLWRDDVKFFSNKIKSEKRVIRAPRSGDRVGTRESQSVLVDLKSIVNSLHNIRDYVKMTYKRANSVSGTVH